MKEPKYSKNYCRTIANFYPGIQFVCFEPDENAYYFQSGDYQSGFYEYRLLESDITPQNAILMFKHGFTNTNKAKDIGT